MSEIKKLNINGVEYDLAGGGTSDYTDLDNKPQINGIELSGNKTTEQLGIEIPSLAGYATEEWVEGKGYLTEHQSLAAYRTASEQDVIDETKAAASDVSAIQAKIPSTATSTNQLADKAFVNSTVGTNTAIFRGTYNSVAELEAYSGEKTNNDYAFVITTDSVGNTVYNRYKYNGTAWVFEYALNNSSFTAAQWAAIQSGITAEDVALIGTAVQPSDLPAPEVFTATYDSTTYAEIVSAANSGKKVQCKRVQSGTTYIYDLTIVSDTVIRFGQLSNSKLFFVSVNTSDSWTEGTVEYSNLAKVNEVVAKAQGVAHAGEFLVVGDDGNVTTMALAEWQGGSY